MRLTVVDLCYLSLVLLLVAVGGPAFAQEPPVSPQPVPIVPRPQIPPQERLLSPIPERFDWMSRQVRPNPLLEALLGLWEGPPRLFMSVSLAEEYSDNFLQTQRNRQDEYRTIATLGTIYRLQSGRSFASLANAVSATYEARADRSNFGFANLSLNAGHQLPPWTFALSDSLIRSDDLVEATPTGLRRERRTFLLNSVTPQIRYEFSRVTSASLAYTNTLVQDEDPNGGAIRSLTR